MAIKNAFHSSVSRVLATYAVGCFVALQILDIILEPLGVSLSAMRWVLLIMIAIAPVLVLAVAWHSHRKLRLSHEKGGHAGPEAVFRIGHAELDTAQRQIRFSDTVVEVQPKVFDLIEYLVRSRDRVVGKDELFDNIWPSVVVTEASLTQSIKRARDLFRQNGFNDEVIRTVSRKGYQFDYPVEVIATDAGPRSDAWSAVALPVVAVGVVALIFAYVVWHPNTDNVRADVHPQASQSLVVLPFVNMTPDADFGYFSDGLTDTVTSSLTTLSDLRVIARGSAFSFRDAKQDYSRIGDELKVAHIVEGSVQRDEDELRISARLIRAADGEQIWSQIYSRSFRDIFAIQDDISRAIVSQMSVLLSTRLELPGESSSQAGDTGDAEAYRLLLLGREQKQTGSANGWRDAESTFRAALVLRPQYPEAMVALAEAIRTRAVFGELPRERTFAEALALIRQALDIDPQLGDAYLQLGEIQHRHFWNFNDAADSYEKALQLNPGSASSHSLYSRFLSKAGLFDESIRQAEVALDLDPKSARAASSLAIRQIRARRLPAARQTIDALAAAHPRHADLPWLEANWQIRNGSYREALEWVALEELDYLRLSLSAIALHHLARTEQARETLDELIAEDPDGAAFQIAEVFAQWGDRDAAFAWLGRAFSQGDPGLAELYSSVNLENLYADPRFATLASRIGLPMRDLR